MSAKKIVHKITNLIESPAFIQHHRHSAKDFTRSRTLSFANLIKFQLNMVRGALQDELNAFFATLEDKNDHLERRVTDSAYCQARRKLNPSVYQAINQHICDIFYAEADVNRWHGKRLLAVDGSVMDLPDHPELWGAYGAVNSSSLHPSARLSTLYDPLNQLTVDLQIASCCIGERELAGRHLSFAQPGDLVLYDRGYPAFWLFALHQKLGVDFCARTPWNLYNEIRDLFLSREKEGDITLTPSAEAIRQCQELGLSIAPLQLRVINIDLPDSDEPELLITSLTDSETYPHEEFAALYHQRWFTEESYKTMKSRLEIENLTGYSIRAVEQDISARWVTMNLNAILIFDAEKLLQDELKAKALKNQYKVNRANSLRQTKHNIVRLFQQLNPLQLWHKLIKAMALEKEPVRTGRKYPRTFKKSGPRFPMRYKRV